ncbi:MAG: UDP-N-acetylmuramoyl-tripeptide--D-alanyl-D-alanine ligase [Firmicutes bacterium ADurb.Bin248]|nr:MAG: UDP-N-acetylmuramoyl-tripeptide--D-alanyl-D-alanine ligase [Firmicutes bacterium ADurb.Bin248]HOF99467.1 UDP-N-acetylmuramoyl-tripeptide--D-alanyl-D-alanine ligase [Clostridia bacterium]HPK16306.1 UDP-N-acetylmuramoyl-tripeptide--D-alanyl-D-alanine ligase [Clostridia bacterium]
MTIVQQIMAHALAVLMGAAVAAASLPLVHIMQLESYQGRMYLRWLSRHVASDFVPYLFAGLAALLLRASYMLLGGTLIARICYSAADFIYIFLLAALYYGYAKKKHVKPLVYTGRVIRLLAVEWALAFLFSEIFFMRLYAWEYGLGWWSYLSPLMVRYAPGALLPLFVLLAYCLVYPVEEGVKRWYFNDAKKKLAARGDLIKIGITGSFGKTGTKYALEAMLNKKYRVLITPGSYNTPMGVTRVIRGQLEDEHEVFVAEMGARFKGDIRELCGLVKPQYGVITAVGKQHLETFGSVEKIAETKGELLRGLGEDGCCLINGDDENCRKLYEQSELAEKYLYGTEGEGLFMRAENIKTSAAGSTFDLVAENGERASCKTQLLGKYNILNLTGAAALAYRMGMGMGEIAAAVAEARPVEHRLQLIPGAVTVIDDAFNANPVGSREALNVLAMFEGKKIVVTPGMVEQGAEEDKLNREFGRHMADCADIAIIIGKRHADPICDGLLEAQFPRERLVRAESLAEATELLKKYTEPGCVVLFENDLPDNFAE